MYYPVNIDNYDILKQNILEHCDQVIGQEIAQNTKRLLVFSRLDTENCLGINPLKDVLSSLDLIQHVFVITLTITIKQQSPIHVDPDKFKYSLNIPLLNCQDTYLNFYEVNKEFEIKSKYGYGDSSQCNKIHDYTKYDKRNCSLISKNRCDKPAIVDTKIPHMFYNIHSAPRVMLLIRLKNSANDLIKTLFDNVHSHTT